MKKLLLLLVCLTTPTPESGHGHEGHGHEGHEHEGHGHEGHEHEGREHEGREHEGHEHEGREHAPYAYSLLTLQRKPVSFEYSASGQIQQAEVSRMQVVAPFNGIFVFAKKLQSGMEVEAGERLGFLLPVPGEGFIDLKHQAQTTRLKAQRDREELSRVQKLLDSRTVSQKELLFARSQAQISQIEADSLTEHMNAFGKLHTDLPEHKLELKASRRGVVTVLPEADRQYFSAGSSLLEIMQDPPEWMALFRPTAAFLDAYAGEGSFELQLKNEMLKASAFDLVSIDGDWMFKAYFPDHPELRRGRRVEGIYRTGVKTVRDCLPSKAFIREGEAALVFVHQGHDFDMRRVRLGLETSACTEVLEGLGPHEEVATAGIWELYMQKRQPASAGGGHGHAH